MSFSNTYETTVLQWVLTNASVTRPTSWHVGLFTSLPGEAGGGTEVSGGGYARQSVTFTVTGDTASNSSSVEFSPATTDWGTITHMAIFDAASGGNQIAYAALASSRVINTGDILQFPVGDIDMTLN